MIFALVFLVGTLGSIFANTVSTPKEKRDYQKHEWIQKHNRKIAERKALEER